MTTKKYVYDYPEQREQAKNLERGDVGLIAEMTGNHPKYISMIFSGKRRMTDRIKKAYEAVLKANKAKAKVLKEAKKKF